MEGMEDYIWRRRIHHGVRYQKGVVPFPAAVASGLDFNAGLARQETLDPALLTNAVMLELCDFAKTVTKSGMYFLFEILDFNFELGVDAGDEERCYHYGRRLHNKVKLLRETVKLRPQRWRETFLLPDFAALTAPAQPERYYPKRNKMVDCSVLTDGSRTGLPADAASFVVRKYGGVQLRLTADAFPLCMDLGVALAIGDDAPKEKLNPDQITNGIVIELLDFSRVLCGTQTRIVQDLVRHNFGQELDGALFRMHVTRLMDRKYACLTAADRDAYLREAFQAQKRKRRTDIDAAPQDLNRLTGSSKRRGTLRAGEGDSSYMCPVEFEAEMLSDSETGLDQTGCVETTLVVDVKQEVETADLSPRRVNGRPPKTNLDLVSDLFFEDQNQDVAVKTQKQKLWMRRATRSKQILKSSRKNDMFACCRETGLDFNVASGLRWDLDLQRFTNRVLWEVYKFATTMTKSLRSFLFEILDHNFNLVLQDDVHRRNFMIYMITKEKILQNHPDCGKAEFLQSPFQFPEVYNMGDVTGEFQTGQEVDTEQLTDPDPPASATSQQGDLDPHPFCQKLGLDLWSAVERPASQKLDLAVLTTGAVLELFGFVRELCGSVREMVNEVLEHNFDLDLQSGATEASQAVHRWYVTQKTLMKRQTMSLKIHRWLNMVVQLNAPPQLSPEPAAAEDPKDLVSEDSKLETVSGDPEEKKGDPFHICREIGLDLDVVSKQGAKTKLDLRVLTRGVLYEIHQYVEQNCHRYVPSLYEILDYNFDLGPQNHRKVEVAWAVASQVVAIAGKTGRKGDYLNRVVVLPVQVSGSSLVVCKDEPEDGFGDQDHDDILFVQELKPVDIEVVIE